MNSVQRLELEMLDKTEVVFPKMFPKHCKASCGECEWNWKYQKRQTFSQKNFQSIAKHRVDVS